MPTIEMLDDDEGQGTMNAHAMPSQSSGGAEIGGSGEGGGKKKENVPEAVQGAGAAGSGQTGEEEGARSSGGEGEGVKGGETPGDGAADSQESHLTEAELLEIEEKLERARGLKQAGNILFSEHNYSAAALRYTEAIEEAPEKHKECAVFLNNRATCYFKMGNNDKVISDCSQALKLDADYTKCLLRRAQAYETQKKVADAYDDFQRVVNLDPSNSIAKAASKRLEAPAKEEREKQKDEMIGKLKDLGNSVLGRFGISLDNFKAVQDPNTGSYSVSYNPGGGGGEGQA